MAVELINIYKEHLPSVRLIGKRYTEGDKVNGGFGAKWGEWFSNDWFGKIEKLGLLDENDDAYFGFSSNVNGIYEYWIGMFFPVGTQPPDEFGFVDIPEGNIATCWIYGKEEDGDLYGAEPLNICTDAIAKQGWFLEDNYSFFETYNCPRFTTPDEKSNVILDYCFYIK